MPRLPCCLLLLLVLLLPLPADAIRVEDLYRAEVEVLDKSADEREAGFRRALEQVLVKVSGGTGALEEPGLQPMLENPARYIQQYRYERIEDDGGGAEAEAGADEEAEPVPTQRLEVVFSPSRIERDLRGNGITVWGPYRPEVLVWFAYDDGRERRLVAADDSSGVDEALHEAARRRGLPLLLPLLDTEDRRRIEYLDIQGGFFDSVRQASSRYGADIVLVAHVRRTGGDWRGEWTLLEGDERRAWQTRAEADDAVVQSGVGRLAEYLAEMLAGRNSERSRVRVRVLDTDSLDDYARLNHFFTRLPRVDASHVVRVAPREILFELDLRGRQSDLERAIALDDLLQRARVAPDIEDGPIEVTGDGEEGADTGSGGAPGERGEDTVRTDPLEEAGELVYRFTG